VAQFKVGDTIRFKKTGFTAKIIEIGPDPDADDPYEERYFFKFSADDEELVVGEGNQLIKMTVPVARADKEGMEKI
jgi:hypothetical protein